VLVKKILTIVGLLSICFTSAVSMAAGTIPPGNVLSIDDGDSICGDLSLPMSLKVGASLSQNSIGSTRTVARITFPEGADVLPVLNQLLSSGVVAGHNLIDMEDMGSHQFHLAALLSGKRAVERIEKTLGLTLEQLDEVRAIKIITIREENPAANGPTESSYFKLFSVKAGQLIGTFKDDGQRCNDLK
jgi:hypothetical protein